MIETSLRLLVSSSRQLIADCFLLHLLLLMPELRSTYGPQTASDMWSLPQDVTIATDPLGLEEWLLLCSAGEEGGAQLWSDGRGWRL